MSDFEFYTMIALFIGMVVFALFIGIKVAKDTIFVSR